jgi:hypothetical protein
MANAVDSWRLNSKKDIKHVSIIKAAVKNVGTYSLLMLKSSSARVCSIVASATPM